MGWGWGVCGFGGAAVKWESRGEKWLVLGNGEIDPQNHSPSPPVVRIGMRWALAIDYDF